MLAEGTKEKEARLEIPIPNGPRLGNKVIEVEGLQKAFGDRLLIENLSFSLPPAGIVGIIGPNGAGKTTLVPHDDGGGARPILDRWTFGEIRRGGVCGSASQRD